MQHHNLQAYYVPSEDAHQSEYIAPWDARRAFLSGFTGSAGYAVVTLEKAALWTDGRYFLQAERQLDSKYWELMRGGLPETPKKEDWLERVCEKDARVGLDPKLISFEEGNRMRETLKEKGLELTLVQDNLVDQVWADDKPAAIYNPIEHLPVDYSGRTAGDKLKTLMEKHLKKGGYEAMVISELDEIAWLFNLRGSDIQFNPVFFAYALIKQEGEPVLYLAKGEKAADDLAMQKLSQELGVKPLIKPYSQIYSDLTATYGKSSSGKKILVTKQCNMALVESLGGKEAVAIKQSPIAQEKAIKNDVELNGFRECHKRDGAALVKYFAWLEKELSQGAVIDEFAGAEKLEQFRKLGKDFVGLSFDTISGSGPNGAVIHYKPEKETARQITTTEVYLCDSGAQYRDGTTDTTRTLHFGAPKAFEKEAFTRVLKGVIALDTAAFPVGTSGIQLDTLARMSLWKVGLDYRHGTGHGVGHFLNVHEGPHSISFRRGSSDEPLKAGMTVTDEPGYYHDGHFGIRIENILLVEKRQMTGAFGGEDNWLGFENVTMCPIDLKIIDKSLLSGEEVEWVNQYHKKVREALSPLLVNDPLATEYLMKATQAI